MMELHEKIKQRRIDLGLSQDELARKLGYTSRSTIAKIESGINDVTHSKIIEFAKVLRTTPAYLLGYDLGYDAFGPDDLEQAKEYLFNEAGYHFDDDIIEQLDDASLISFANKHKRERPFFEKKTSDFIEKLNKDTHIPIYDENQTDTETKGYITVPQSLLSPLWDYFAIYMQSDSMIDENININDLLVFEITDTLENGMVGYFALDNKTATCKRYYHDKNAGTITLLSANPKIGPTTVTKESKDFKILGKLVMVINKRKYGDDQ